MPLADVFAWIEGAFPARFIVTTPLVYPLVSALHLFGIALLFGSIVPVDLRLLRALGAEFDAAMPSLVRIAAVGFMVAAASGVLLLSVRISASSCRFS
jgi:hypothetical protein